MLSRALISATVMLLIGCFSVAPALAQAQNLEAGKSPSQIFAGACTACHKSPRGLLRTVPAGALQGFLRQHYTTSPDMASLLSAFLISNGAADTRYLASQPKQDRDGKPAARPEPEPQQAARPDAYGVSPQAEPAYSGRHARRLAGPKEVPEIEKPVDAHAPAQAASEHGPDGLQLSRKQKLSRRGKQGIEGPAKLDLTKPDTVNGDAAKPESAKPESAKSEAPAKIDAAKDEPSAAESVKQDKPASEPANETAKDERGKSEGAKPLGEEKPGAKVDAPKVGSSDTPDLRADPVPPVTPAPAALPAAPTTASSGTPGPSESVAHSASHVAPSASPAVTASAPPPLPVAPGGLPVPPISQ